MGDVFQGFKVLFKWKANYVGGKQTEWVYTTSSATFSKGLRFYLNGQQTMWVYPTSSATFSKGLRFYIN